MRSNGLTASAYTPVADLDPRVADALLEELKEQGVAAYTKPVESSTVAGFDGPEFRTRAQDRLFVDAAEAERVRSMIADHDPDLVRSTDDLTWAQIVAGFDQPLRGDAHPWPDTEDLVRTGSDSGSDSGSDTAPGDADASDHDAPRTGWDEVDLSDPAKSRGGLKDRPADADEDHFRPAPPPPLPQLEPWQQLAWVGVLGGPLLLLVAVLFAISLPTWVSLLAVAGFVGGFVTLVARMDGGDSEDDPGNGAVV